VTENLVLAPQSSNDRLSLSLAPLERQRMMDNGTYNPDGTVNMKTAERMGWAKEWRDDAARETALAAALEAEALKDPQTVQALRH